MNMWRYILKFTKNIKNRIYRTEYICTKYIYMYIYNKMFFTNYF